MVLKCTFMKIETNALHVQFPASEFKRGKDAIVYNEVCICKENMRFLLRYFDITVQFVFAAYV